MEINEAKTMNKEAIRIHLESILKNTPKEAWVDNIIVFISVNFLVSGSFTMQDLMLYYNEKKGFDLNSKVVDVLNSMVNDH